MDLLPGRPIFWESHAFPLPKGLLANLFMTSPPLRITFLLGLLAWMPGTAAEIRVATLNVKFGLGAPGSVDHDAAASILTRIDADVVGLQEIKGSDLSGSPTNLESLASTLESNLGWSNSYIHVATTSGVLDTGSRTVFISRYPISSATDIAPPVGVKDMARTIPALVVDVPGLTNDPTIISLHLKCCLEGQDPFRRAVEIHRLTSFLNTAGYTAADNLIIMGDFNLIGSDLTITQANFDGYTGLPGTYILGPDVNFPVEYHMAPATYFTTPAMVQIDSLQTNGSDNTLGSGTLDFILATSALTNRTFATEIYNSVNDTSNGIGLPKFGSPLPSGTSGDASDHFAVFGDFDLDGIATPTLSLAASQTTVAEDDPSGTATLDVTLSRPPGNTDSFTVNLSSNGPTEATLESAALFFGPTDTFLSTNIVPQTDGLVDGTQTVTFTASSSGLTGVAAAINVLDIDVNQYVFTGPTQTILENFDSEAGTTDPLNWISDPAGNWLGTDNGAATTTGKYAYRTSENALGILPGTTTTFTAHYLNDTGAPINAMQISYDAEQWGFVSSGAADTWSAELIIGGTPSALGPLNFAADTSGSGTPGTATALSTIISSLNIPDSASFQLRFTATPGAGTPSSEVFINEIHYENISTDAGEFVEVVVAPGFSGTAADIDLYFYDGLNGGTYSPHSLNLGSFTVGALVNGYQFYSILESSIANGPDGLALVDNRTTTVLQFISYEGSFTATAGPANGLTSIDIGVSQNTSNPVDTDSLGLTGSGSDSSDLTWTEFTGIAHSPGALNDGQTLVTPGAPAQGIALDNVSITLLIDTDGDGDPDLTDPDDDGDGQSDGTELLITLTDPLDRNSLFTVVATLNTGVADSLLLNFPTLSGRTYSIYHSTDGLFWNNLGSHPGTGTPLNIPATGNPLFDANLFRVGVTLP